MFRQNNLTKRVDHLIALFTGTAGRETAQESIQELLKAANGASIQELNDAVTRLAALIPNIAIHRAGLLAIVCGSLVEQGADMAPIAQPALARFSEAVQQALPFVEACVAEAVALHRAGDKEAADLSMEQIVERFGPC